MEEHIVKIIKIEQVTHDVKRFQIEKPEGYSFVSGQATEVAINSRELLMERRPFTFTSINCYQSSKMERGTKTLYFYRPQ